MKKLLVTLFLLLLPLVFFVGRPSLALECGDALPSDTAQLQKYMDSCNAKIASLQSQASTLKAAIGVLDSKIRLTTAQIKQTTAQIAKLEEEINALTTVVTDLNANLDELAKVFVARVRQSYIRRDPDPIEVFLSSDSFAKFFTRIRYLSIVKTRDQLLLSEIEKSRANYDSQKNTKIIKQKEVEDLKAKLLRDQADLSLQQRIKRDLLVTTQNDEQRYQGLLSQARSELEAINAIISGGGTEVEIRDVNQGDLIANLINGKSCNSGGTHLHFIIAENGVVKNPLSYLKPIDRFNCSGIDGNGNCFDADPFNPTGSWEWPLSPRIQLNQGYGETWAVRNTWVGSIYRFHNGLDIEGGSLEVRAVQPGKLYRGTYSGTNGCALKYVRVDHKDNPFETYYLHVNYN